MSTACGPAWRRGLAEFLQAENPDVICLQETKMQKEQVDFDFPGYTEYWFSAEKKGYSGTAVFTKTEPLSVSYGIGLAEVDAEGRVICAEYPDFYLVTVYTPNAQRELVRIDFRMAFEDAFRAYLEKLHEKKAGHRLRRYERRAQDDRPQNAKANIGNAGFSYEERGKFSELLAAGFNDSFRMLYPDQTDAYSWWSYMGRARRRTRLAHRLFPRDRRAQGARGGQPYPERGGGQRPPPGGADFEMMRYRALKTEKLLLQPAEKTAGRRCIKIQGLLRRDHLRSGGGCCAPFGGFRRKRGGAARKWPRPLCGRSSKIPRRSAFLLGDAEIAREAWRKAEDARNAALHRTRADYANVLGRPVHCVMDRPLGSRHPRYPDMLYTVNYGYVPGVMAGDGSEQDVYVLGPAEPLETFDGVVLAVIHRFDDCEDKWVVAAAGARYTAAEIRAAVAFQEKIL